MGESRIGFWLSPEGRALVRGWAQEGLSQKKIAANMGVNVTTFRSYKKKYAEFADCLDRKISDYEVENALREKALGGNVQAAIFLLKNNCKCSGKPPLDNEGGISSGEGVCIIDDL